MLRGDNERHLEPNARRIVFRRRCKQSRTKQKCEFRRCTCTEAEAGQQQTSQPSSTSSWLDASSLLALHI